MITATPDSLPAAWEKLYEAQWAFVLDFYARPGVSKACLELQENLGVDVPVLLHAVWLHCAFGSTPDADEVAALDAAVEPMRTHVIGPLRGVRHYIKAHPLGLPAQFMAELRKQIAEAELHAERGAFALLAARGWSKDRANNSIMPAEIVVRHYLGKGDSRASRAGCEAAIASLNVNAEACRTRPPEAISSSRLAENPV